MSTTITPASIKQWLKLTKNTRAWLAAQCGVSNGSDQATASAKLNQHDR